MNDIEDDNRSHDGAVTDESGANQPPLHPRRWLKVSGVFLIAGVMAAASLFYFARMWRPGGPSPASTQPQDFRSQTRMAAETKSADQNDSQPLAGDNADSGPDKVYISPEQQQLIGIQTERAVFKPLSREIRAAGKVTINESQITHIHTKVPGFIEEVFANYVGQQVRAGDPLFSFYSPELVATQEEYLIALRNRQTLGKSSYDWVARASENLVDAARERLRLWDIRSEEIEALEREGKVKRALTVYSPVDGTVTERAAFHHGRAVTPETDLYTLVDLSTVWIVGDVYESDLPFVKVGQPVQIEFPAPSQRPLAGRISFISPFVDPKTRTAQVRTEFANPGLALKPDMFVNFRLAIDLGRWLVVPQDALLDTGTQQYVFVDEGEGYFRPTPVKPGPQTGEFYAIESGLRAGDRVVTAANFVLDSESRLKGAFANMGRPRQRPLEKAATAVSNLKIEILEPKTAKVGRNAIRLRIEDASGKAVTDAEVLVTLFMPQMGSMPPMTSEAELKHVGNGQYEGSIEFQMAWTWQTTVTVKEDGQAVGSMRTNLTAR